MVKNNDKATVSCNTSAGQFFSAQISTDALNPIGNNYRPNPPNISGVFNYSLLQQWAGLELMVLENLLVPYRRVSPFQMALQQSNLSELHLSYYGISVESPLLIEEAFPVANTPANDYWILEIGYTRTAGPPQRYSHMAFLPNGSLDLDHTLPSDLEFTNKLLAPTMKFLQVTPVQFWEVINWIFVTFYWTILADLGQIVPITYPIDQNGQPVLSSTSNYLPTNNIFLNETLYQIYSSSSFLQRIGFPPPLDRTIGAGLPNMTFIKSYSCTQRQLKPPINFIISVAVADYALIMGGYSFALLIAGSIQKHRRKDGKLLLFRGLMNLGNHCEGCTDKPSQFSDTIPLRTYHQFDE